MRSFLLAAFLLALAATAVPARAERPYVPIEQRLSTEQLRSTGLDQLRPDQLALLNTLLQEERAAQVKEVREEVRQGDGLFDRGNREPILSKIVGEFRGWSGSTSFTLENGEVWRVTNTPEYYVPKSKARSGLAVSISPGLVGGMFMQVEGHSVRAKVNKIK